MTRMWEHVRLYAFSLCVFYNTIVGKFYLKNYGDHQNSFITHKLDTLIEKDTKNYVTHSCFDYIQVKS